MVTTMTKELYEIGDQPPVGEVPPKMNAWLIRESRFGQPTSSFQKEVVDVPAIKDDEVLVYVMAAGVNYNNVWAALGIPVNVIKARQKGGEKEDFHIGGSDASGIVYKVGKDVRNVKVGDEVVIHCATWDRDEAWVKAGNDPMYRQLLQDLGLRDQLRQLRPVHQGAGAPVHAEAEAYDLGRVRVLRPGRCHRLAHAARLAGARDAAGRSGADLGRRRRSRLDGHSDRQGGGGCSDRRRLRR